MRIIRNKVEHITNRIVMLVNLVESLGTVEIKLIIDVFWVAEYEVY